jgi:hypothetical protein
MCLISETYLFALTKARKVKIMIPKSVGAATHFPVIGSSW